MREMGRKKEREERNVEVEKGWDKKGVSLRF